jgi:hypothetical protein
VNLKNKQIKNKMEIEKQNNNVNEVIKKKRGRKPKNNSIEENIFIEKKKRGRKKKYEIENSYKIINRDHINNFNHNIVYSDDEEVQYTDKNVKNISFGNLNITVSKKDTNELIENSFKGLLIKPQTKQLINENELESDEEKEIPIENILSLNKENYEKHYKETKKYVTDFTENIKEQTVKRMRVVTCLKNVITYNEWPTSCDICCWWCCHKFENTPCTLPTKYDSLRKRFTFMGLFCSWNCSKAYNLNMSDYKKYERNEYITQLIQSLYGIEVAIRIKPAPPRESLKMFGGYLDIHDFRNKYDIVDSYHINLYQNNFIFPEISEVTNIKITSKNGIEKKNLRLQRN